MLQGTLREKELMRQVLNYDEIKSVVRAGYNNDVEKKRIEEEIAGIEERKREKYIALSVLTDGMMS